MTYTTIHLIRFIILSSILLVSFLVFTAPQAHAYFTTNQEATALDNNALLFNIEYTFGHERHALHMPVFARTGVEKTNNAVSYAILDENNNEVAGKAMGIVFSDAKLTRNGTYMVSKDTTKKFTLAVVFVPTNPIDGKQYRMQVTHLPFNFDGTQELQLNPSELQYYTTKLLTL